MDQASGKGLLLLPLRQGGGALVFRRIRSTGDRTPGVALPRGNPSDRLGSQNASLAPMHACSHCGLRSIVFTAAALVSPAAHATAVAAILRSSFGAVLSLYAPPPTTTKFYANQTDDIAPKTSSLEKREGTAVRVMITRVDSCRSGVAVGLLVPLGTSQPRRGGRRQSIVRSQLELVTSGMWRQQEQHTAGGAAHWEKQAEREAARGTRKPAGGEA